MRIYVIRLGSIVKFFVAALIVIIILFACTTAYTSRKVSVFSQVEQIPIYCVEQAEKTASITFDCAWGAGDIPDILQTLKKENIKATFFLVGQWAEKYPEATKLIAQDGHDIANHSYSHLRMGAIDNKKIRSEISLCNEKLYELTGKKVDLFRAPYGDYNKNVVAIAKELGCYTIQWDVDSLDWKPGISQQEIISRITKRTKPGSIILFHNDTPHTAKILPEIIAALKNEGYGFAPVSKMILRDNYSIDHEGRQRKKEK